MFPGLSCTNPFKGNLIKYKSLVVSYILGAQESWAHFSSPLRYKKNLTPSLISLFNLIKVLGKTLFRFSQIFPEKTSPEKNVETFTLFLISAYDFVFFHLLDNNPILSFLGQLKGNSSILLISRKLAH